MPRDYLETYVRRTWTVERQENGAKEDTCLPEEARQFFWFTRLELEPGAELEMPSGRGGFYGAIGVHGQGELRGGFEARPIRRGKSYFIPASLTGFRVANTGDEPLEVYCCFPPTST